MLAKMWPGYWLIGGQAIDPTFLNQKKAEIQLFKILKNPIFRVF